MFFYVVKEHTFLLLPFACMSIYYYCIFIREVALVFGGRIAGHIISNVFSVAGHDYQGYITPFGRWRYGHDRSTAENPVIPANICIAFIQRWPNVFDVGSTLYKCYTNVLGLLR